MSVAFGACCFFPGLPVGDCSAVPLGVAVSLGVADGVSEGSGVGDVFFFRCDDEVGDGVGEAFFLFGLGEGDSSSGVGDFFFFGEGDGVAGSFSRAGDNFLVGVGVGVGDFFCVAVVVFFFRGFGVGVGVEKIFFSASPRDCSAGLAAWIGARTNPRTMRMRRSM